ncbi:hypothetical protein HJC23_013239 [Cyclotella cryptica]|uniref:Uncharacterized protein n=1 Tax=Cyclotella cryptica TaxID=29204 RepID=A0ABD3NP70_9STRA|eukprot:CCRYP_020599-RA/>CCRYP_020599-RA protein AED:0.01 eAED:0.01 QI:27/1/1/1/1/1/4/94/1196
MTASITTAHQTGPHSSTDWIVCTSPTFRHLSANASANSGTIASYRSPNTNLRGLIVRTDEPVCSLHIIVSTESNGGDSGWHHPDDGLPHTLEHLVFLGSLTHPHKGVLDKLANRCMASGTNAWTATDHTAYTLSTAGGEGMLNLLPIFADHVLFPTLTKEGFVTEVHCVNGKGEDKGVVYCEMQGRENTEGSLIDRAIMDLLYPDYIPANGDGNNEKGKPISCGYSAETGGKMANLRTLSIEKIRRYHREYYRSDNTLLLVTGNVESEEFFNKLDEVEALVLKRRAETSCNDEDVSRIGRPWINSFVPLMDPNRIGVYPPYSNAEDSTKRTPLVIHFPSEDESRGTISIAWRGPPYSSRATWAHLSVLWDYLTESATSPLQLAFVENDNPLCAYVGPAHDVFTEGYHQVWFQECDVEKMDKVVPLFYDVMAKQAGLRQHSDGGNLSFDVKRMETVIRRYRRRLLEASERRPTDAVVNGIVRNFLYGSRAGEEKKHEDGEVTLEEEMAALHADTDVLPFLDEAETKLQDSSYWQRLIIEFVLDRPMAVVLGKPSAAMANELSQKEKEREAQQAQNLGEDGLKNLANVLEAAMAKNEEPIPEEILTSLPIPDLEKVPSIPLFTARLSPTVNDTWSLDIIPESVRGVNMHDMNGIVDQLKKEAEGAALGAAPFHADFTHIDSAFVFAAVGVDTTQLTTQQRLYLPILDEILFKLPATLDNGEHLTKEEFVNQIHNETVSFSAGIGLLGGSIPQMAYVSVQTENSGGNGLKTSLTWIRRVLYQTQITNEAVKTAVQRLISEIPPQVRHGPSVAASVASELMFSTEKSNTIACNVLRQKPFLSKLFERIGGQLGCDKMELDDEDASVDDSGIQEIVLELEKIRKTLFQPTNYHAFVAGNLRAVPNVLSQLVNSLLPSTEISTASGRLIENVSASSVRRPICTGNNGGDGAVCGLSAIESGYLNIITNGVKPYDPNRPAVLVAIEYLTALEGDFWVKLRGAGLTYSYSISDSTDSELLKFGLFKCTDIPGAFEKASEIIADYASNHKQISHIGLENAKASLAYQIISGRSSKLSAATSSFVRTFKGEKMDYDRYLLSGIAAVTEDDVTHALITYLVPCFDPLSNLIIACPPNKLDAIHEYFVGRGWTKLKKVPEENLFEAFAGSVAEESKNTALPEKVAGMSMFLPGAFASQFRCTCPKCGR